MGIIFILYIPGVLNSGVEHVGVLKSIIGGFKILLLLLQGVQSGTATALMDVAVKAPLESTSSNSYRTRQWMMQQDSRAMLTARSEPFLKQGLTSWIWIPEILGVAFS